MKLLTTLVATLAVATPAHAFEVAVPTAAPDDKKAGQHSDVKLRIEPSDGSIKDVDIHFPAGLVGDPNATGRCTHEQFEANACPPETKLGTSNTEATLLGLPQTLSGEIFNLQPRGPEPARLGIIISPPAGEPVRLESPVTSRTTDGGLDSTLRDIPNSFEGVPITITALDVTLLGTAPTGKPFMQNPTSCGKAETVVNATSYEGESAEGRASFESTDCQSLPFAPSFEAVGGAPGENRPRGHPPLTTVVGQVPGEANVKSVAVQLPSDFAVGADRLGRACPQADFDAGRCAPTARIGDATAITPLLTQPLTGAVTFVAGTAPLPDLVLTLTGPLSLTLRGTNAFATGGQVTTFDGIPDVPLSRFELSFYGGDRGLLAASRDLCAGTPPQLQATFVSHAGTRHTATVPARIEGCDGSTGVPPTAIRKPKARIVLRGLRRGRPSLKLNVTAGTALVRRVRLGLPRGLKVRKGTRLRGAKLRSKGRAVEITPRGGVRRVSLRLRRGTLAAAKRVRAKRRLRFTVRVTDADGKRTTRRPLVRARR
ncbi:MAG TPA: hypothetical protein VF587_10420 [Solirubrobacteraceae bacterium]|jgi:hypothetical protein